MSSALQTSLVALKWHDDFVQTQPARRVSIHLLLSLQEEWVPALGEAGWRLETQLTGGRHRPPPTSPSAQLQGTQCPVTLCVAIMRHVAPCPALWRIQSDKAALVFLAFVCFINFKTHSWFYPGKLHNMLLLVFLIRKDWRAKAHILKIPHNQVPGSASPAVIAFAQCGVSLTSFKYGLCCLLNQWLRVNC